MPQSDKTTKKMQARKHWHLMWCCCQVPFTQRKSNFQLGQYIRFLQTELSKTWSVWMSNISKTWKNMARAAPKRCLQERRWVVHYHKLMTIGSWPPSVNRVNSRHGRVRHPRTLTNYFNKTRIVFWESSEVWSSGVFWGWL